MATPHRFDPSILREYDIRGVVDKTLFVADAEALGLVFGTIVRGEHKGAARPRVFIGRDGRLSSPALKEALCRGLLAAGCDVEDIGVGPTPMLYFAVCRWKADGGVMVTGSHNPPDHNGFKMMLGQAPFFGEEIQALGRRAAEGIDPAPAAGALRENPVFDDYLAELERGYDGKRGLTVAWDPGNGATGDAVVALTKRLPGRHLLLNERIDGTFPAHHPDPTVPKNLEQLIATVEREHADLGIAFDGDGDRIGVVDGKGRILWGDQLMILFARDVLAAKPGSTIIADVQSSQVLFEEIERCGGKPVVSRSGHSLIKRKMKETGAQLAGEVTGHLFFADRYYGFDDALYAAVRLLGILGRKAESLTALYDRLPRLINTPQLRVDCPDERKFAVVAEVRERLAAQGARFSDVDGVRVMRDEGWWLLRASNTQPALVARCEGRSDAALSALKAELAEQLALSGIRLPGP
jgi:phosphomannomutase